MEKLKTFVDNNDVDFTKNLLSEDSLNNIISSKNLIFGVQLKEYILTYGYLGFDSYELYGINSVQKENSDMIKQTEYLNKYFEKSIGLVALENLGEGDYALVDSNDNVLILSTESDSLQNTNKKLEDYIIDRFK